MSSQQASQFTKFSFTESELLTAALFVDATLTREWLQTLQAEAAEAKLNIPVDTEHPLKHLQELSFRDGQLEALRTLLDAHAEALIVSNSTLGKE